MSAGMQKALDDRCKAVGLNAPTMVAKGAYRMGWEDLQRELLELAACWTQYGASTTDAQAVRDAVAMVNQLWDCTCPQHTGSCEHHRPAYFRQHEDLVGVDTSETVAQEVPALAAVETRLQELNDGPRPSH